MIVPTGHPPLDGRIKGIPEASVTSVSFRPGTAYYAFIGKIGLSYIKTTGKTTVYIAIDRSPSELSEMLKVFNVRVENFQNQNKWTFVDVYRLLSGEETESILDSVLTDIESVFEFYVFPHVEQGSCVIIDSLTYFFVDAPKNLEEKIIKLLLSLKSKVRKHSSMCILSFLEAVVPSKIAELIYHYADNVFNLILSEEKLQLSVLKVKGVNEEIPYIVPYEITPLGLRITTAGKV
ncbi:MAG: RAD55 family ATPase [Candidatus Baldrarchaeia archaeon]